MNSKNCLCKIKCDYSIHLYLKSKLTRIKATERKSTRIQVLGSQLDLNYLIFYGLGKIESEATNTKLYG